MRTTPAEPKATASCETTLVECGAPCSVIRAAPMSERTIRRRKSVRPVEEVGALTMSNLEEAKIIIQALVQRLESHDGWELREGVFCHLDARDRTAIKRALAFLDHP
jgi:hypothetical protein